MSVAGAIARERFEIKGMMEASNAAEPAVAEVRPTSGVSQEDFILLQQRANQFRQEIHQLKDALIRAKADYDNLKRRSNQEKSQLRDLGKEEALSGLLDVVDNFDRAVEASRVHNDIESIREGIVMVQGLLVRALASQGLEKVEALGAPFDPNVHEAIGTEPTNASPENTITAVMASGYKVGSKVLRPAKVIVAKPIPA